LSRVRPYFYFSTAMQPSYDSQKEGRILLAIQAFNSGQFKSLHAASRAYDVPKDTLARRYHGTP